MTTETARRWGPWRLDPAALVLYTDPGSHVGYRYEIDLESCLSSAAVLDWVCQIEAKGWGTPAEDAETVAGLVAAFVDILAPQARLCSWGRSRRLTRRAVTGLVAAYTRGSP